MRHQARIAAVTSVFLALASIALVRAQTAENTGGGFGTAFIVHPDGLLLTAYHVIDEATSITVSCGGRPAVPAVVKTSSPTVDLAVLEADGLGATSFLRLSPQRVPSLGDRVFTIGHPLTSALGTDPVYSEGAVSSLSGLGDDATYLQISVPLQPGNSGGPLVNEAGNVVGVVVAGLGREFLRRTEVLPQNINFGVKSAFASVLFEPPPADVRPANASENITDRVQAATCFVLTNAPENSRREAAARPPRAAAPPATRGPGLIDELRARARQGDIDSQFELGRRYDTGRGVPQDDGEAVSWYERAAQQGSAEGQYKLGFMYFSGRGVPQAAAVAHAWWRRAADQGHADAQYHLGSMYYNGFGVAQDDGLAMRYFRIAAEKGHIVAQALLGIGYGTGRGVEINQVQSYLWCNLAASPFEQGRVGSTLRSALANSLPPMAQGCRDASWKSMFPSERSRAERLVREWAIGNFRLDAAGRP